MGETRMKSLKFFEAEIELLSPAIVVSKMTKNGYARPLDYIPGSTLRGALLATLYRSGFINEDIVRQEASEPSVLSSPAYPVIALRDATADKVSLRRTLPATPVIFRCKICGKTMSNLRRLNAQTLSSEELRRYLVAECPEHGPAETLYSHPVYEHGNVLREFRLRVAYATSVSIHKELGIAMRGMLFSYEAIAEGTRFWARLVAPDYIAEKIPKQLKVTIGRGASRGFGLASIKIRHEENPAKVETTSGIFISLSPLTPLSKLSYGGCEVRVSRVLGKLMRMLSGWDMVLGMHKPFVELVKPGAIVKAEMICRDLNSVKSFTALLSYGGIPIRVNDTWLTGFNVLIPVDEYERLLGEKLE